VFLGKDFCSKPVFKVLNQYKLSFVIPIPARVQSGGVRRLFESMSRKAIYTFHSPNDGAYKVQAVVAKRYSKGCYGCHTSKWFAVSVGPYCR